MPPKVLVVPGFGQFAGNQAKLGAPQRAYLRRVAQAAGDAKRIRCEGHTSTIGATGDAARRYRYELALARATMVCDYLRATGVKAKLSVVGYGAERPRASNATERGRELNRRVELRIWR